MRLLGPPCLLLLRLLSLLPDCVLAQQLNSFESSGEEREALLSKDDISLVLMGDTQYHFMCELSNPPCREASRRCRLAAAKHSTRDGDSGKSASAYPREEDCVALESRFANRVQRKGIEAFVADQRYPPVALIINGDLTNFGHFKEMHEFKAGWMHSFPLPILAGLGNHDYQNNINDCAFNSCARNMLWWFNEYAKNTSLAIDFDEKSLTGSLAYAKRLCSLTGKQCVHVIQLHNAIDYSVNFTAYIMEDWRVQSPFEFLRSQFNAIRDMDMPILINMHQNEDARDEKLKKFIDDWIYSTRALNVRRRIGVFFAHMHARHEVKTHCFHGVAVPFVYVGSVPNNRFTVISFGPSGDRINGYVVREERAVLLDSLDDLWATPCNRSFLHYFHEQKTPLRRFQMFS